MKVDVWTFLYDERLRSEAEAYGIPLTLDDPPRLSRWRRLKRRWTNRLDAKGSPDA